VRAVVAEAKSGRSRDACVSPGRRAGRRGIAGRGETAQSRCRARFAAGIDVRSGAAGAQPLESSARRCQTVVPAPIDAVTDVPRRRLRRPDGAAGGGAARNDPKRARIAQRDRADPRTLTRSLLPTLMPMSFRPIAALVALATIALLAAEASALTLLADENPPFNFTDRGRLAGSSAEIVLGMASRAGVSAKVEMLPWDKAYVRAQGQSDACLLSTARFENRERLFRWVGPIATNWWAIYGKSDFAPPIRTLKDLAPYRIGTLSRDATNDFLRDNGVTDLRPVDAEALNPPRLLLPHEHRDHIDLWIAGLYAGRNIAQAARVGDLKVVFIASEQPLFLACNPQLDPKTVKALADALDALKADGTFARITSDYEKRFPR
jgi:polar amino acid transport system substrate-binding protein